MANIKDLILSIESADSSFDEKLAAINKMEETLVAMRQQEEQAVQDNVDLIVEAIKLMEKKVTDQLEIAKSIVPEKGDKGDKGERGADGKAGRDGLNGRDGKDGRDGVDGADGVSVTDAKIDFDGSLVITLSTGREINVGEVVAPDLAEKIKVITTMSTNGAVAIKDEGSTISSGVKSINFVGSSVTATNSGDDVTVTITGGGGAVDSVNGQTGVVVLTASDVGAATTAQGALADSAVQPGDLATVATTGAYSDLTGTPTIPSALTVKDEGTTLSSAVTSIDFTGAGVTATNTGGAISVAITGGGGGGISSADIQEFTSTGSSTWTKPSGAKLVYILVYGGGSGGGSGRRRATASSSTAAFGGGGGASGGRTELWIPATELGATETVTVGAGGTGGAAITVDDTNGASGAAGQNSSVGSWITARGAVASSGGTTSSGSGASGGNTIVVAYTGTTIYSGSGAAGSSTAGNTGSRGGYNGGGGGGGGGFAAASTTENTGGAGGKGGSVFTTSASGIGSGGSAGGFASNGGNGSNATTYFVGGDGGGSGGSGNLVAAGAGGNGGFPGGGGGGGGAGHGANSGAGGNGGNGYVRIVTFF